jgi:hypothetical protein
LLSVTGVPPECDTSALYLYAEEKTGMADIRGQKILLTSASLRQRSTDK